jgi:hypothetical protein
VEGITPNCSANSKILSIMMRQSEPLVAVGRVAKLS